MIVFFFLILNLSYTFGVLLIKYKTIVLNENFVDHVIAAAEVGCTVLLTQWTGPSDFLEYIMQLVNILKTLL